MPIAPFDQRVTVDVQQVMPQVTLTGQYVRQPGLALEYMSIQAQKVVRAYDMDQQRLATYNAMQVEQDFQTQQALKLNDAVRTAQDGAPNLHRDFMDGYATDESEAMAKIDPRVAEKFAFRFNALKQQFLLKSFQAEQTARDAYYTNGLTRNINEAAKEIDANSTAYQDVTARMMANIDVTGLPEATKQQFRDNWNNVVGPWALHNARVSADPHTEMLRLTGGGPTVAVASTLESTREPTPEGYGKPLHGTITLNGHTYDFVTGGRKRGSIPFGTYKVGAMTNTSLLGNAFPINDVYDPMAKDIRTGLFIHAGDNASEGCIAIKRSQWAQFEKDMQKSGITSIVLKPNDGTGPTAKGTTDNLSPRQINILNAVKGKAQEIGLPPDFAAATLLLENAKMDPNSVSATGMHGLFQLDREHSTKYGDTSTLEGQINAGVRSLKERWDKAREALGRDPQAWEAYLFHYQGEGGGAALLKANPSEQVGDVLARSFGAEYAQKVLAGNPDTRNKTVGDFINGLKVRMNNALSSSGGEYDPTLPSVAPEYAGVSYNDLMKMRSNAAKAIKLQAADEERLLTQQSKLIEDDTLKTIYEKAALGTLTQEDVFSARDALSAAHYEQALKMLRPGKQYAQESDWQTYTSLMADAGDITKAKDVIMSAGKALDEGRLSWQSFKEVSALARETIKDPGNEFRQASARSLLTRTANLMKNELLGSFSAMGSKFIPADLMHDYLKGSQELEAWHINNPNASAQEIIDKGADITRRIKQNNADVKQGLVFMGVTSVNEVKPQDIGKKAVWLEQEYRAGRITREDFNIRVRQLTALKARIGEKDNAR